MSVRDMPADDRWPDVIKYVSPEKIAVFLQEWLKARKLAEDGKVDTDDMRDSLHEFIMEQLKDVPREQLVDSLAETLGSAAMSSLRDRADRLAKPESDHFKSL